MLRMCASNSHGYTHLIQALGIVRKPTVWVFVTSEYPGTHDIGLPTDDDVIPKPKATTLCVPIRAALSHGHSTRRPNPLHAMAQCRFAIHGHGAGHTSRGCGARCPCGRARRRQGRAPARAIEPRPLSWRGLHGHSDPTRPSKPSLGFGGFQTTSTCTLHFNNPLPRLALPGADVQASFPG